MTTMGPCPLRIPFNIKTICHPERRVYGNDAWYIDDAVVSWILPKVAKRSLREMPSAFVAMFLRMTMM